MIGEWLVYVILVLGMVVGWFRALRAESLADRRRGLIGLLRADVTRLRRKRRHNRRHRRRVLARVEDMRHAMVVLEHDTQREALPAPAMEGLRHTLCRLELELRG